MQRWDIINALIQKHNYKSFLEIGYYKGWSFDNVKCNLKTAVDPDPSKTPEQEALPYRGFITDRVPDLTAENVDFTYSEIINKQTSDDFFRRLLDIAKWDIIFIDGLHEAPQVYRDIENSLKHLSPGGTIVLHDCNPPKYEHTTTGIDGCWTGDTYKAFVRFRMLNPEYYTYTVDTDWGCGIIETPPYPGNYAGIDLKYVEGQTEWENFTRRREDLLNLISIEEFKARLNERTANNYSPAK